MPRILLKAFAYNTGVPEKIIYFTYLWFIFQHCQRQYLGLLVPHEKMIGEWWTGKWKETVVAQQQQPQGTEDNHKNYNSEYFLPWLTSTQVPPEYKPQTLQTIKLDWFTRISSSRSTNVIIPSPLSQRRSSNTP
jgi:hypothetical protein